MRARLDARAASACLIASLVAATAGAMQPSWCTSTITDVYWDTPWVTGPSWSPTLGSWWYRFNWVLDWDCDEQPQGHTRCSIWTRTEVFSLAPGGNWIYWASTCLESDTEACEWSGSTAISSVVPSAGQLTLGGNYQVSFGAAHHDPLSNGTCQDQLFSDDLFAEFTVPGYTGP
jgi:hypothetical protein